jgi:TonB family protein
MPLVKLMPASAFEPIAKGPDEARPPGTRPAENAVAVVIGAEPSAARAPSRATETTSTRDLKRAAGPVADAAPESDSESDAFARIGSVRFKNGKLDVRLGRKVKTVKPRFTIKGGLDQLSIVNPVTVVRVTIADSGKVSDVRVIRSSGSNELDLPWVLAVYRWWFEPATDSAGNPTTDIVQLTLGIIDREY